MGRHSWDAAVVDLTRAAQAGGLEPMAWALQVAEALGSAGVALPSPDLARLLVSHVCWENNVPAAWKYLEKAMAANLAPSMLVIALLSTRVFSSRNSRPAAYRLYMEILRRHSFSFFDITGASFQEAHIFIDDTLHLSQKFGVQASEPGVLVLEFIVCIVWQLLDASLEDGGSTNDKTSKWVPRLQHMEIDRGHHFDIGTSEDSYKLQKANTVMAIEIIGQFLCHKITFRLLYLAYQNSMLSMQDFVQRLHLLGTTSLALQNTTALDTLVKFSLCNLDKCCNRYRSSQQRQFSAFSSGPFAALGGCYDGATCSAVWIPLELYLEDCIDETVAAANSIKVISGLLKAIQSINRISWHDAFLALWTASLRLVQRERVPAEGPVPHTDTRLCILLSITTLSVCDIIDEERSCIYSDTEFNTCNLPVKKLPQVSRREALISSLQMLGDYEGLLAPPPSVVCVANQAAAKAMMFISSPSVGGDPSESSYSNEVARNCSGNLWHLIVESCIARSLVNTSAYYWPGYVNGVINQESLNMPSQIPGWCSLMEGSQLTSIVNILKSTPAPNLAELEKIFEIAVSGSDDDRVSAASILCGGSLIHGWNIQEYTVRFIMKLLLPPAPVGYSGSMDYLISHGPVMNILLTGISSVDCIQIFSFHGVVPELAGALMRICEVFGSCTPKISWTLPTGEEVSPCTVFSNSFILLLRLWKFNQTPLERHMMGDGAPIGSQLTLEYLLLLRNSQVLSFRGDTGKRNGCGDSEKRNGCKEHLVGASSDDLILLDSYPKLKFWYRQHQACLASTLSGLVPGTPVHQNVDTLLSMMFRIKQGSNQSVSSGTSSGGSINSSSVPVSNDTTSRPNLPAWDILEAVPFVVDAALTACSHGRLSPRKLVTGLKDLADFLPASLATIVGYFSSEVTRGVWQPADMNGTDWPSPTAKLSAVEENIKKIVSATGVDVPSLVEAVSSPTTLPLPLAAFASLTITYKLDKSSARFLDLAGPALENLAASCPWPSMPIVAALWVQKVKRWGDFLTFSASRTVFIHNHSAVSQLLKSCFATTLGLSTNLASSGGGVGSLLGQEFSSHFSEGLSAIAPGILYLRTYRTIRGVVQIAGEILSLLIASVGEISGDRLEMKRRENLNKSRIEMKYGQVSFISASRQVRVVASLAATLVWLSGGSSLIQWLFLEMLPSWFLSTQDSSDEEGRGRVVAMLKGYALAYFAIVCGNFAWGINSTQNMSTRRKKVVGTHMLFLADAIQGKISVGCSMGTWRTYVSSYLGLMVDTAPSWISELDPDLLKRISIGLRRWNEDELAFLLLVRGGIRCMGTAAEFIIAGK